ncbi:ribosomal protein L38 [Pelomyxa schiedti]|nr:ribosomal protein L38 [Pelomyxa schiedti]
MPKEVKQIKEFLLITRRKDAKVVKIKKSKKTGFVKFKVRCRRYLYTLRVFEPDKVAKVRQALPPSVKIQEIKKGRR